MRIVPRRDAATTLLDAPHRFANAATAKRSRGRLVIRQAIDLCEDALAAATPTLASDALYRKLAPVGVSYVQARRYRRPVGRLTSRGHWDAGGFVARYSAGAYLGTDAANYVCFELNPLIEPVATGVTRFRFSDYAPHADRRFGRYWDAYSELGIAEAVSAVAYSRDRRTASLHIGFPERHVSEDVLKTVQDAASLVAEKLMAFAEPGQASIPALSPRERDAIAFVAEGKTDWEVARIMGVAEATARFHVDNARRKLGATNRAHAVARFIATHGLF